MEQNTQQVVRKISELKEQVPSDWAERISEKMGKSPESVWAYARGERGVRKGCHLQVLRYLTAIHKEHMREIQKLTA